MILTSSYNNIDLKKYKDQVVSISGDRGKSFKTIVDGKEVGYTGPCYSDLAPKKGFWLVWHDNIGKISPAENAKFYIREFYKQVLSKLDVNKVYEELDNKILLCYEDSDKFCHRQIVAAWFELFLGIEVPEVVEGKDMALGMEGEPSNEKNLEVRTKRNAIKNYLEEVIMSSIDMKGFKTLYALNLYKKGLALEEKAQTNNDYELAKSLQELAFGEANIRKKRA